MSNKETRKMDRLVVASISSSLMLLVVAGLVHPSSGGITTTSRSTSCGYQVERLL
jgi:hypothetical protein